MDGSVLDEKPSFNNKMLGLTFPSILDRGYYIISISEIVFRVQLIFWKCFRENLSFRNFMLGE